MSEEHLLAQARIVDALRRHHPDGKIVTEGNISSANAAGPNGRGDVVACLPDGTRRCIEVQRSRMSAAVAAERHDQRRAAGYTLDWVFLGESRRLRGGETIAMSSAIGQALATTTQTEKTTPTSEQIVPPSATSPTVTAPPANP